MSKLQMLFGLVVGFCATLGLFGVVDFPAYLQVPFTTVFIAIWLFTAGIHAKQMFEKDQIDSFLKWVYAPLVVSVILMDVIFNATVGTLVFKEPPKEWLFTNRVKRELKTSQNRQAAKRWAQRLNWIDPGHV